MATKKRPDVKSLYYMTSIDNLPSILKHGVLSHAEVERRKVTTTAIYDSEIVQRRRLKETPDKKSLWEYANFYFQPRNPMLYRVLNGTGAAAKEKLKQRVVLGLRPQVLDTPGAFVTDGNAASDPTNFYDKKTGLETIDWDIIHSEWWKDEDGSKRKIMAEGLVPGHVSPDMIHTVFVANEEVAALVRPKVPSTIAVIPEPAMFFLPLALARVTPSLSLIEGDMFFSRRQTLTISVNTVGVMGKGLASRTRYQFPDVYVAYEDACKSKKLTMGKPFLYKRERSLDEELIDDPNSLPALNDTKWFLLFATKDHWRNDSNFAGIEQGLAWVAENYKELGIKSLAMPALGCGLGNLSWSDVGPLMCRYLAPLDITCSIYLPRESAIPADQRTPEFLLKGSPQSP
jgi:ssDNA thymidine ADP-ribosyltransferase, DarT/Macro domain